MPTAGTLFEFPVIMTETIINSRQEACKNNPTNGKPNCQWGHGQVGPESYRAVNMHVYLLEFMDGARVVRSAQKLDSTHGWESVRVLTT